MARTTPRPCPTATQPLPPLTRHCPVCGNTLWAAYPNYRTITTLTDVCPADAQDSLVHHGGMSPVSATIPARGSGAFRPPQARVWSRCHRPGRYATLCPAPQCAGDLAGIGASPCRDGSSDGPASPGALRRTGGAVVGRSPPTAADHAGARSGHLSARWVATGRWPRGVLGPARLSLRGGTPRPQPAVGHPGRPGRPAS